MSNPQALAEGLARRGQTIPGLKCYSVMLPKPDPPCLCVNGPIRWTYDETMDGYWRPVYECWVFVNPADLHGAQRQLRPYMAPSGQQSLPAAIYGDATLGGLADTVTVLGGTRPPGVTDTAGGQLLGFALEVEVLAVWE